ncbi:hypothetical protein ACS0TY_014846 [Phlomoides rotata]
MEATTENEGHQSKVKRRPARWSRQKIGQNKLNTDAAIFRDGIVGLGFIVRDDQGKILLTGSMRLCDGGSSTLVEARALLFGFETFALGGLTIHAIETDSERLIQTIKGFAEDEPYLSTLEWMPILYRDGNGAGLEWVWPIP